MGRRGMHLFERCRLRAGKVALPEGQPLPVKIEAFEPRDATDRTLIGRLVLSHGLVFS
jgi:hypothetical protein